MLLISSGTQCGCQRPHPNPSPTGIRYVRTCVSEEHLVFCSLAWTHSLSSDTIIPSLSGQTASTCENDSLHCDDSWDSPAVRIACPLLLPPGEMPFQTASAGCRG